MVGGTGIKHSELIRNAWCFVGCSILLKIHASNYSLFSHTPYLIRKREERLPWKTKKLKFFFILFFVLLHEL
jgi:hypothetical protein